MSERLVHGAAVLAFVASIVACHSPPSEPTPTAAPSTSANTTAQAVADAGTLDAGDAGDAGPTDAGRDAGPAPKVTAQPAKKLVGKWALSVTAESAMKNRQDIQEKNPNMSDKQLDWELKLKKKRLENTTFEFNGKELKRTMGSIPPSTEAYKVDREDGALVSLRLANGKLQMFKFLDLNTVITNMAPDGEVTLTRQ